MVSRGGEKKMGTVISFPAAARVGRGARSLAVKPETATVIILPVIRIERYAAEHDTKGSEPDTNPGSRRRRRPRANRS